MGGARGRSSEHGGLSEAAAYDLSTSETPSAPRNPLDSHEFSETLQGVLTNATGPKFNGITELQFFPMAFPGKMFDNRTSVCPVAGEKAWRCPPVEQSAGRPGS